MINKRQNSDLAIEALPKDLLNKEYTYHKETISNITIETYKILKTSQYHPYSIGTYKELSFTSYNNELISILNTQLQQFITSLTSKPDPKIVIAGLGNIDLSCDALGPETISCINATHHYSSSQRKKESLYNYICIIPGVTSKTGIETASYIHSIVKDQKADLLIVIDALKALNYEKLCKVIQINNTGIYPGSGIGNHRKGITYDTMGIPVIAIGIPTVIHAVSMINEMFSIIENHFSKSITLNENQKRRLLGEVGILSSIERQQLLYEIISPLDYNYIVCHKQIDYDIKILSHILAQSINTLKNIK